MGLEAQAYISSICTLITSMRFTATNDIHLNAETESSRDIHSGTSALATHEILRSFGCHPLPVGRLILRRINNNTIQICTLEIKAVIQSSDGDRILAFFQR